MIAMQGSHREILKSVRTELMRIAMVPFQSLARLNMLVVEAQEPCSQEHHTVVLFPNVG